MTCHQAVLLKEAVTGLGIRPDGIYIDGTFGRGGHSRAILNELNAEGRLIAIDKDEEAIIYATTHFAGDARFTIVRDSFANIATIAQTLGVYGRVNGILLDLGVSSPQLDNPTRGFSFMREGPLDLRMDNRQTLNAAKFINHAAVEELTRVFREYGEERFAHRIARAIETERLQAPIVTTTALAAIIKQAHPKWEKHKHPATRVFQAIRIHINQELADLQSCLKPCVDVLALGGRLVVISFHSLEDRIVKQFMRDEEQGPQLPHKLPVKAITIKTMFKRVGRAIKPHNDEIKGNVRARSAVLRIGEKIA